MNNEQIVFDLSLKLFISTQYEFLMGLIGTATDIVLAENEKSPKLVAEIVRAMDDYAAQLDCLEGLEYFFLPEKRITQEEKNKILRLLQCSIQLQSAICVLIQDQNALLEE